MPGKINLGLAKFTVSDHHQFLFNYVDHTVFQDTEANGERANDFLPVAGHLVCLVIQSFYQYRNLQPVAIYIPDSLDCDHNLYIPVLPKAGQDSDRHRTRPSAHPDGCNQRCTPNLYFKGGIFGIIIIAYRYPEAFLHHCIGSAPP